MAQFRKRPVIIEAVQFNPHQQWPEAVKSWKEAGYQPRDGNYGYVETLEGKMHVSAGDWIVTGIKGERYPVKDDIFRATYDPVA